MHLEFEITPTSEDGVSTAVEGEDAIIDILVESNGQWDGVVVRVITPSGSEDIVTKYRETNLYTQRIYEYTIATVSYEDRGVYQVIASDSFGYEMRSSFEVIGKLRIANVSQCPGPTMGLVHEYVIHRNKESMFTYLSTLCLQFTPRVW